jgi:hypothetical protein
MTIADISHPGPTPRTLSPEARVGDRLRARR